MSGSIAAIAAYDGTGTQGYRTTDKSLPGVKSIFWNENDTDKYYVNGSSYIELDCNIETENEIDKKPTYIFTIPNDYDAVDQPILEMIAVDSSGEQNVVDASHASSIYYNPSPANAAALIEKIEFCIGNQIICTQNTIQLTKLNYANDNILNLNILPSPTMTGANYAYLLACANNQTVQLKVYINSKSDVANTFGIVPSQVIAQKVYIRAFANFYSMTNVERDMLRGQTLPKAFPLTQYSDRTDIPDDLSQITINCDHFNIDCSYIEVRYMAEGTNTFFDVELFLNSTSYSGILKYKVASQFFFNNDGESLYIPLRLNNCKSLTDQFLSIDNVIYDKSGLVPLSKYDSIKIVLTLNDESDTPEIEEVIKSIKSTTVAVAYGLCTAMYQDGAVTFNNY